MEEKKETSTKLSYEQLEQIAAQLQQKLIIVENKLRSIDFTSMRLTWLFKVLENENVFSADFTNKCSKEVEELLTLEEDTTETKEV